MSRALSKSPGQVRTWIRLARLPDSVLDKLQSGESGTQHVRGVAPRLAASIPFQTYRRKKSEPRVWRLKLDTRNASDGLNASSTWQPSAKEQTGVHVNAHMADAVARSVKSGHLSVDEAVQRVIEEPKRYSPIATAADLGQETSSAYSAIQMDIRRLVYRLRPEIAVSFTGSERQKLEEGVAAIETRLREYRSALSVGKLEELPESAARGS